MLKRKILTLWIALALTLTSISIVSLWYIEQVFAELKHWESIKTQVGVSIVWEQMQSKIASLNASITSLYIITLTAIVGAFLIFAFLLRGIPIGKDNRAKPASFIILPRPKSILGIALIALAVVGSFSQANASSSGYRPRVEIPQTVTLPSGDTRTFQDASADINIQYNIVRQDFVAYLLGIATLPNFPLEFIEVGYFQNATGFYLYSSQILNGQYSITTIGVSPSGIYSLKIESIGTRATATIVGVLTKQITFTHNDPHYYAAQGETNWSFNSMNGTFSNMQVGYLEWQVIINSVSTTEVTPQGWVYVRTAWPTAYTTKYDDLPFQATLHTASPYITAADVWGNSIQLPPSNNNGVTGGGGGDTLPRVR